VLTVASGGFPVGLIPFALSSNRTSGFPRYGSPTIFPISLSVTKPSDHPNRHKPSSTSILLRILRLPLVGSLCFRFRNIIQRLFRCMGQSGLQLRHFITHVHSSFWSTHAPLLQDRHDRSVALRSDKVMLSLSSSLQGHSDFPTSITVPYGAYPACALLTAGRSPAETLGSQVLPP